MPKVIANVESDILEAARRILMQTGYETFNMRALAEECGISVGTLYNHYPSKIDIVLSIMEEAWEHAFAAIDEAIAKTRDPVEQAMKAYTILRQGYTDSHSTWIESYDAMTKDMAAAGARACREGIHAKLAGRVFSILQNAEGIPEENSGHWRSMGVRADALSRLIQAYCAAEKWSDNNMRMLIASMIRPNLNAAEDINLLPEESGKAGPTVPKSPTEPAAPREPGEKDEEWILW